MTNPTQSTIEDAFRRQVRGDAKVKNTHLLVSSESRGVELRAAEGRTGETQANPRQPIHMTSVGKLFTATVSGLLHEAGELSFDAPITTYLDEDITRGLHVFRGQDLSGQIQVRHLLNQSSGLADEFWPLLQRMREDPSLDLTPREAVLWGKEHLSPKARPGQSHHYTDTNYHLLGLIVEQVTGAPFHQVLHGLVFSPLGMDSAFMQGYSRPAVASDQPVAEFYVDGVNYAGDARFSHLDYAGGGVTAELDDYLRFMQALVEHHW
ncbi:MAG: beta-lactamase family protein [Trueperaceae bacterium]|nr:beta-lactamase family protein [Trueperaceae bacterium]